MRGLPRGNLAGKVIIDEPAIGRVAAVNLTRGRGGVGALRSDEDLVRAIRHGVAHDGRPLKIMPSSDYMNLTAEDLAAVVAYVKSVPPVDNELPPASVGSVGRALFVAGMLPFLHAERLDHARGRMAPVMPAATAEYGGYLASIGCKGCHGPALVGGTIIDAPPDWPPAANLTPAGNLKSYTEDNFRKLIREGMRPGGIPVKPVMAWKVFGRMTDDELRAIFFYLKSVPATATPGVPTPSS